MKKRNGFVSNSSTSSFICEVCGHTETGYDCGVEEAGMCMCVNEHTFCLDEKVKPPKTVQTDMFDASRERDEDEDDGSAYEVPESVCPICSFTVFSASDLAALLLKLTAIPRDEAWAVVKAANKRRKKLYDSEYNMYAAQKMNIDLEKLLQDTKDKYPDYKSFRDSIEKFYAG